MCRDWTGRPLGYEIQFECLGLDCHKRYALALCDNMDMYHHCTGHSFDLNTVRDMFGEFSKIVAFVHIFVPISFDALQFISIQ